MCRIGFNALGLKNKTGGVESHIYNVIKHILEQNNKDEFFLFIGKNTEYIFEDLKKYKNLKIKVYPVDTNNSTLRVITEHTLLALGLIKNKINLVHHFCNYMPRLSPVKSITTLHDLSGFFYHDNYSKTPIMSRYYKHLKSEVGFTLKHSDKIIVISEFTRSEVHKYYKNVDNDKMITIGMSPDTRKQVYPVDEEILNKFQIKEPYLLSVSVVRPHKNYEFLIKVFNGLKEKYNIPHQLVICGGMGNEIKEFEENAFLKETENSKYKNDIKYLGYTDNKYMSTLYNKAEIYVTSTVYEGFGMPILEAMYYNLPIACSDAASLPEVGGNGCVYFNPYDVDDAVDNIYKLISDKELQNSVKASQHERLDYYSWDKVAQKILELYEEVLS